MLSIYGLFQNFQKKIHPGGRTDGRHYIKTLSDFEMKLITKYSILSNNSVGYKYFSENIILSSPSQKSNINILKIKICT